MNIKKYYDNKDILIDLMKRTIDSFIDYNYILLKREVSERALCGALMLELYKQLQSTIFYRYFVDVEFNRSNIKAFNTIKRIPGDKAKNLRISTDLIVHGRGILPKDELDNLIVIEIKRFYKDSSRYKMNKEKDLWRLEYLTLQEDDLYGPHRFNLEDIKKVGLYGYKLGVFLKVDYNHKNIYCEFYVHGAYLDNYTSKKFDFEEGNVDYK